MRDKLIKECYERSKNLLNANANPYGFMAAKPSARARDRRYTNIFGRDASITALGAVASGDKKLVALAKKSLLTLAQYQSRLGQVPYSVNPDKNEVLFYFMGDKDSTLWWLIALDFYHRYSGDNKLKKRLAPKAQRALKWLFYQDQNNCGLIEQCEASDWEDLMPDNGSVLYTNVLWYQALALYGYAREKKLVLDGLRHLFLPHEAGSGHTPFFRRDIYRRKLLAILKITTHAQPYFLDYVTSFYGSERFDTLANLLSVITGVADKERAKKIIKFIIRHKLHRPLPSEALYPVIKKGDSDWRDYLKHRRQNLPHQYHNGGAWPFIGCFWAMALGKTGRKKLAWAELAKVAEANQVNDWQFNEWFHGQTGQPMGMPGQTWNAGAFLAAYHYLKSDFKF
ncbi:MAG: glycoside hydrolase [Planctomycetes bacterium]|nr:glycoside hydrolase [Planctomycetota bacterium]